jgi:predicted AAA+ superfamily ATPase
LAGGYLYQDLLQFEDIKKPQIMEKLLRLLAFQVGSEVSFSELASRLNINTVTVQKYIDLLEKSFIIFTLQGFSRNLRNEVTKSPKIYFYDLGIRNALIENFKSLDLRDDIGSLWENFLLIERIKNLEYNQVSANIYFWRNYQKQEIDYVEEKEGVLNTFEFKWNSNKKAKLPNSFKEAYPNYTFEVINKDNWLEFVDEKLK